MQGFQLSKRYANWDCSKHQQHLLRRRIWKRLERIRVERKDFRSGICLTKRLASDGVRSIQNQADLAPWVVLELASAIEV